LPNVAAIYFVLGDNNQVLYVGRAKSLCFRWQSHHRLADFKKIPELHIAYLTFTDAMLLPDIEKALIAYFDPPFNNYWPHPSKFRQTSVRVDATILRKARFYLDEENKSIQEFLSEQLERYVEEREQASDRQRREAVSA